jgi:hypothetical protein
VRTETQARRESLPTILAIRNWLADVSVGLALTAFNVWYHGGHTDPFCQGIIWLCFAWTALACVMAMDKCFRAAEAAGWQANSTAPRTQEEE